MDSALSLQAKLPHTVTRRLDVMDALQMGALTEALEKAKKKRFRGWKEKLVARAASAINAWDGKGQFIYIDTKDVEEALGIDLYEALLSELDKEWPLKGKYDNDIDVLRVDTVFL